MELYYNLPQSLGAVDSLGRSLPTGVIARSPKERAVGLF